MRSGKMIKNFIAEQYIEVIYSHVPINRTSNLNSPVSNSHVSFRYIPGNVNNEVAVVPNTGQKLSLAVGTGVAASDTR